MNAPSPLIAPELRRADPAEGAKADGYTASSFDAPPAFSSSYTTCTLSLSRSGLGAA